MSNNTVDDKSLFEDEPVLDTPKVEESVAEVKAPAPTPNENVGLDEGPEEDSTEEDPEEDPENKKNPPPQFSYTNPNIKQGQWAFKEVDKTKAPWKYQTPLAGFNHTIDEANKLTENPYYRREDATFDLKWSESVTLAQDDNITSIFYGDSLAREDSDWGPKVEYEGQRLGPHRPKAGPTGDGEKVFGLKAVSKVQALLGLGGMIKVPLWHSGLYVSIKAPTDIQLLNFYETISREKIELGKNTVGLIFSNSSSYVNSAIYDLAVDCIYESSVRDVEIGDLKEIILMNDFPIIAWALACSIYPNGYSYVRPCIVDPEVCQHVVECLLDLGKLMWVDRAALSEKQRRHMALIPRTQVTRDQVKAYQDEFDNTADNQYESAEGITVVFKQPTLEQHLESGARWIEELDNIVRDVFTDEVKQDRINHYISERASLTKLRSFTQYIKHIVYTDDNSTTDEAETLERVMDQLSASPEFVSGMAIKLNSYIDKSAVALIGLPRVPCPKCKEESQEDIEAHPWIIPLNPVRLFFKLRDRKLQQSIPT